MFIQKNSLLPARCSYILNSTPSVVLTLLELLYYVYIIIDLGRRFGYFSAITFETIRTLLVVTIVPQLNCPIAVI